MAGLVDHAHSARPTNSKMSRSGETGHNSAGVGGTKSFGGASAADDRRRWQMCAFPVPVSTDTAGKALAVRRRPVPLRTQHTGCWARRWREVLTALARRNRGQNVSRVTLRAHLGPHLHDLALRIDQERVAVGDGHAAEVRPASRTRPQPCVPDRPAGGTSAHPWCRTACGCRGYPRSRPRLPRSRPQTWADRAGSCAPRSCSPVVMSLG